MYSDPTIPLPERATRLLVDTLLAVHEAILTFVLGDREVNLSRLTPLLDHLAESATEVQILGSVSEESTASSADSTADTDSNSLKISSTPSVEFGGSLLRTMTNGHQAKVARSGVERHRVHFGGVGKAFEALVKDLEGRHIG